MSYKLYKILLERAGRKLPEKEKKIKKEKKRKEKSEFRKIKFQEVFYQRNIELDIEQNCHECTSHCSDQYGYPKLHRDGFIKMHRWVYWKATGDKPKVVMHLCDNPKCININHLKGGTHLENMHDIALKNRIFKNQNDINPVKKRKYQCGEKHYSHKLTALDVRYIRLWLELGYKGRDIAKIFKVSEQQISDIKHNKSWKVS